MTPDQKRAKTFRHQHMLTIALAVRAGDDGDIAKACDMAEEAFAQALADVRAEEREACAKVAEGYAKRMSDTSLQREQAGKPNMVAECKSDAGYSLAAAIRSRTEPASSEEKT